jgi:hypothetical protein
VQLVDVAPPGSVRIVGYTSTTFSGNLDSVPTAHFEKVVSVCAVMLELTAF